MIRSIVLVALFVSAANAARQIVTGAPPPPPAVSGAAPGALVGVVIPGYTAATFGTAQITNLCEGIKNITAGYPKQYITCTLGYKGDVDNAQAGVPAVGVNGYVVFNQYSGMSTSDKAAATISRDAFVNTLLLNNTKFADIYPNANTNNTCTSQFSTGTTGASSALAPVVINGVNTQARCRIASKGYTTVDATGDIKFNNGGSTNVPATTIGTVGLDNGKSCPFGSAFITAASPTAIKQIFATATADLENVFGCVAGADKTTFTCYMGQSAGAKAAALAITATKMPSGIAYASAGNVLKISGTATGATG